MCSKYVAVFEQMGEYVSSFYVILLSTENMTVCLNEWTAQK